MMRRMVADSSWRATLAANGRQRVQDMYAAKVVGAVYAEALREIWDLKNKVGTQQ
jgi:hypothetical protein